MCVGHPLNTVDISKVTALKKSGSPFSLSYELSIAPLLGVGLIQVLTTELEKTPTGAIEKRISRG